MVQGIAGKDVDSNPWSIASPISVPKNRVAVAAFHTPNSVSLLSSVDAARIGDTLLSAADIDIVGAARKVVEADQAIMSESAEPAAPGLARVKAIRALASELAKLDGVRS